MEPEYGDGQEEYAVPDDLANHTGHIFPPPVGRVVQTDEEGYERDHDEHEGYVNIQLESQSFEQVRQKIHGCGVQYGVAAQKQHKFDDIVVVWAAVEKTLSVDPIPHQL